jgi:hypothetical protein
VQRIENHLHFSGLLIPPKNNSAHITLSVLIEFFVVYGMFRFSFFDNAKYSPDKASAPE